MTAKCAPTSVKALLCTIPGIESQSGQLVPPALQQFDLLDPRGQRDQPTNDVLDNFGPNRGPLGGVQGKAPSALKSSLIKICVS